MNPYDGYTKYDQQVAQSYDQDRMNEEHWRREDELVRAFTARATLGRLLDLPVGTGRFLEHYASALTVTGVDISEAMLDQARMKAKELGLAACNLETGDAFALEYADDAFDSVICFRLVHLLPADTLPRFFAEMSRVTSGTLLLQIYAAPAPTGLDALRKLLRPVKRLLGLNRQRPWSGIQSYLHRRDDMLRMARDQGLTLVNLHDLGAYNGSQVEVLELKKDAGQAPRGA